MSKEIGELLGNLKEKNVIDFEESLPIILIDRLSTNIFFEKTYQLRVKRFTSLVARYIPILHYLSKHLTYENNVVDVKRVRVNPIWVLHSIKHIYKTDLKTS